MDKNDVVWLDAAGEVEEEMMLALKFTQVRIAKKLRMWKVITFFLLFICYVGVYTCAGCFNVASPLIGSELNYTSEQLTDIITISTLVRIIPKIFFGFIVDYFGGKKMLVIGCIGMVTSCLAFPLGTSLWWMTLGLCAVRLFGASAWPSIVKIASKWFLYTEIGMAMALLSLSYLVGDSFALLYIGALASMGVDWKGLFFIAGATLFVFMIIILLALRGSPIAIGMAEVDSNPDNRHGTGGNQSQPSSWKELVIPIFTSVAFWLLLIEYSGLYLIRQFFFDWTVQYLLTKSQSSEIIAVLGLILFNFFGGVSVVVAGFITDKLPDFRRDLIMSFYCLLLCVGLFILCIMNTSYGEVSNVWFSIWVIGLCGFALFGPYSLPAGVMSIKFGGKKSCASMSGLLDGLAGLASMFAGPLGRLATSQGYQYLWGVLSFIALLSFFFSIAYAFADRREIRLLRERSLSDLSEYNSIQ